MSEPDWTTHVVAGAAWRRFGLMLLLVPVLGCVGFFVAFTALFQFFSVLANGEASPSLSRNGEDLNRYASSIIAFLTYNSERRPFPFAGPGAGQARAKQAGEAGDTATAAPPRRKAPARKAAPRKTTRSKKTAQRRKTASTTKKKSTRSTTTRQAPPPSDETAG